MDARRNFAYGTVLTPPAPAASGTSLTLSSGNGANFPQTSDGPYNIVVWPAGALPLVSNTEIIRVGARTSDTLSSLTRSQEGTPARIVGAGDQVMLGATAKVFDDLEALITAHAVNVMDFGATGNGVTDDTAAFTAAIAATFAGGGTVFVPAGTYVVQPLAIPPGTILQGVNGQSYYNATTTIPNVNTLSRLQLKAASTQPLISPDDSGTNDAVACKILNLALDCNGINQPAINLPDQVGSISRFWLIQGVYVSNVNAAKTTSGYAVYVGNQNSGVTMRDCIVFNGTSGSASGYDGIGWYGPDGRVDNTAIGYFANVGLNILGGAADETFSWRGGGIFSCATNVAIGGGGAVFEAVSIDHALNDGVFVSDGPTIFIGCSFHENSGVGVAANSNIKISGTGTQVTVIGCRAWGTTSPQYMIKDVGTNTVLKQYGGHLESGSTLSVGWTNYAPTSAQISSNIADIIGAPPTVTGSRASNVALASLLTKLASLGIITDSTT